MARKYAQIFVRGQNFPRAKLKDVQGQIAVHICAQTEDAVFITLHIF